MGWGVWRCGRCGLKWGGWDVVALGCWVGGVQCRVGEGVKSQVTLTP